MKEFEYDSADVTFDHNALFNQVFDIKCRKLNKCVDMLENKLNRVAATNSKYLDISQLRRGYQNLEMARNTIADLRDDVRQFQEGNDRAPIEYNELDIFSDELYEESGEYEINRQLAIDMDLVDYCAYMDSAELIFHALESKIASKGECGLVFSYKDLKDTSKATVAAIGGGFVIGAVIWGIVTKFVKKRKD